MLLIIKRKREESSNHCSYFMYIDKWHSLALLYATPRGWNDDWFWIPATVVLKCSWSSLPDALSQVKSAILFLVISIHIVKERSDDFFSGSWESGVQKAENKISQERQKWIKLLHYVSLLIDEEVMVNVNDVQDGDVSIVSGDVIYTLNYSYEKMKEQRHHYKYEWYIH